MTVFFDGMLYGLLFILALGPAFFALLHTALKHGFKKAMAVSVGVNMADGTLIALVIIGLGPILEQAELKFWFGLGGALILLIFGVTTWMSKKEISQNGQEVDEGSVLRFWLKGIALNGLNPLIVLFWIGVVGGVATLGYKSEEQGWFFAGFLSTVLLMDALKVFLFTKLSRFLTPKRMQIVNRTVGVIFVGFAVRLGVFLIVGV